MAIIKTTETSYILLASLCLCERIPGYFTEILHLKAPQPLMKFRRINCYFICNFWSKKLIIIFFRDILQEKEKKNGKNRHPIKPYY